MSCYLNHSKMAYTVEEACELVSLSRAQMYRLIDLGELETIKIGKSRRVTSKQLDEFLLKLELRAPKPADLLSVLASARTRRNP